MKIKALEFVLYLVPVAPDVHVSAKRQGSRCCWWLTRFAERQGGTLACNPCAVSRARVCVCVCARTHALLG